MRDASAILSIQALDFPWPTQDPFLFCVHHQDCYPAGDDQQGVPRAALVGRALGSDFAPQQGWRMYHGQHVPGFPRHPHRGFETITMVRQGFVDHSDSMGAAARFGQGDVQWMTAGRGVEHCEMFPLRHTTTANPVELFQLWLNLPARNKLAPPHFSMLWAATIPQLTISDAQGGQTQVSLIAGSINGLSAPNPPPDSWAADPRSELAIWTVRIAPGAHWTVPAASEGVQRALYAFSEGTTLQIDGHALSQPACVRLRAQAEVALVNSGSSVAELLYLQGRPIEEPMAQYGPFVMNTAAEVQQALQDYRNGLFGPWPWDSEAPVHRRDQERFARHADGRQEAPPKSP